MFLRYFQDRPADSEHVAVIRIEEQSSDRRASRPQSPLAFVQSVEAQVFPVAPKQIEREDPRLTTAEQKLIKLGATMLIQANQLAIQHGRLGL